MSTGSISVLASISLQSILASALQSAGLTTNRIHNNSSRAGALSSVAQQTDGSQLSPFAQLMSTLQKLQQSDPTKYQEVTQQISTNLKSAAQTAQTAGNTSAATQLNQLASDFTDASKSSQLPNVQDLAQAVGGQHHAQAASADSDGDSDGTSSSSSSASGTTSSSASQSLSQLLAAYQANGPQSDALSPMSIIMSTLSSAGITGSKG
jgi:hypothetical protein